MQHCGTLWFSAIVVSLFSCRSDDGPPMPMPGMPMHVAVDHPECENLNPLRCMLPWPSSRYLADDPATATGRRVQIPAEALPHNKWGDGVDPENYARQDGFSAMSTMMTLFAGRIDTSALAGADHIERSLEPGSPTVLLDAETGERVAHIAELDAWSDADPALAPFYIRPAQRLKGAHRYVVAIRDLRTTGGQAIAPSDYFRALRDRVTTDAPELEARRARFEDIFALLAHAGVERAALVEAWDFETGSDQSWWGDLVHMRDDAMTRVGARGLGCHVTSVQEDVNDEIYRRVEGTFTVPLYMETDQPGARVRRGADGLPEAHGTAEAPFLLIIPRSVRASVEGGGAPARLLTYGHGLMGGRDEIDGYPRRLANQYGFVLVATDWWGMSEGDIENVGAAAGNFTFFPSITERLLQGVVNTLVLTRSFAGSCRDLPEVAVAGRSVIDPEQRYFLGISQGSIMGTTTAALSTDIDRFVLNVGGISYPTMISRSVDFRAYGIITRAWYPDKVDRALLLTMAAQLWDYAEPATYAPHLLRDPLPGSRTKRILYQIGVNDSQVPNTASDIAARTIGLPLLAPSPYTPWNVEPTAGPADSAYVIFDVHADPVPPGTAVAADDTGAHEAVRRTDTCMRQIDAFLRPDGRVQQVCDGPCDPD